jgi:Protein of unknown function (DUF3307)
MIVLIKLILAHLLGDFLLQPDSWVKAKEEKKLYAWQLYVHALIHFALILLLIWDLAFWKWALLIAAFHLIIDIAKVFLQKKKTKRTYFFADQLVHLLFILFIWILYRNEPITFNSQSGQYYIALATFLYAIIQPSSVLIRKFISRWTPETGEYGFGSLEKAGNYIGIFERLFVFAFVVAGQWEAIGFLLAAKSVFRFGDLRESKDRKLTEYVLIGTLLSFGIAMLLGEIFLKLKIFLA